MERGVDRDVDVRFYLGNLPSGIGIVRMVSCVCRDEMGKDRVL